MTYSTLVIDRGWVRRELTTTPSWEDSMRYGLARAGSVYHLAYMGLDFNTYEECIHYVTWDKSSDALSAYENLTNFYALYGGPSLDLKSDNTPVVVGVNASAMITGYQLEYRERVSQDNWTTEVVQASATSTPFRDGFPILLFDGSDAPHIFDRYNGQMRHFYKSGGVWTGENLIASDPFNNKDFGAAIDSQGVFHLCFMAGDYFKYVTGTTGSWTITNLVGPGIANAYEGADLVLDASDRPHIAYVRYVSGVDYALYYTHFNGSTWDTVFLKSSDADTDIGGNVSLCVTPDGSTATIVAYLYGDTPLQEWQALWQITNNAIAWGPLWPDVYQAGWSSFESGRMITQPDNQPMFLTRYNAAPSFWYPPRGRVYAYGVAEV